MNTGANARLTIAVVSMIKIIEFARLRRRVSYTNVKSRDFRWRTFIPILATPEIFENSGPINELIPQWI